MTESLSLNWYSENIEEPVRDLVKLLRDNGVNTECSCGHKMYVQCQFIPDRQIMNIENLLLLNGYSNYKLSIEIKRIDGHFYGSMGIFLPPYDQLS